MKYILPFISGAACGALAGCGVGGGTLLLLYLTALAGVSFKDAKFINLLFFIVCAAIALVSHIKNKLVCKKTAIACILWGAPLALLGAIFANRLSQNIMSKIFAVLFIAAGVREIFASKKQS